ncbi:putative DNA-binding domain-containing protein [Mycobacterium sp. SP-6446]|uniref:HvfC/BufC family peptide modification chaperone n=1 Tax=Mycobacterium sp. SP-6446 TaxID=1834162 RepID=UPI0011154B70|nr:putative DNA-binding domain-containing protein [Mycobacterium sp. SP-6446]
MQGWLQTVVRYPGDIAAAVASPEARRWLDLGPGELDDVVCASAALTPAQRLGLYAGSYRLRLLECLRELHPALRHALGPALFDGVALNYLQSNPSTSYTLFELDRDFADHLAATQPALADGEEPWPSFLVDMARLERLFLEVYDGPGVEAVETGGAAPAAVSRDPCASANFPAQQHGWSLSASGGGRLPAELPPGWAEATVSAVPCLRLLTSRYPVGRYLLAVRRGRQPALPLPQPCFLALNRRDYRVVVHELEVEPYSLLVALVVGAPLAECAAAAGMALAEAWRAVRGWAAQGYFRAIGPVTVQSDATQSGDARVEREPVRAERIATRC